MNVFSAVLEALLSPSEARTVIYVFESRRNAVRLAWRVENGRLGEAQVCDVNDAVVTAIQAKEAKQAAVTALPEAKKGQLYDGVAQSLQINMAIGLVLAERADFTQSVLLRYLNQGTVCYSRAYLVPELSEAGTYNIRAWVDDAYVPEGRSEIITLEGVADARSDHRVRQMLDVLRRAIGGEIAMKAKYPWAELRERLRAVARARVDAALEETFA